MRGGMNVNVRTNSRIGKDKADGMVDASGSDLVGIEEQWSNRKSGGIGAGALISTPRGRIHSVKVPNCNKNCTKSIGFIVSLVGFVEFALAAVNYDKVAIAIRALIARLPLNAAPCR